MISWINTLYNSSLLHKVIKTPGNVDPEFILSTSKYLLLVVLILFPNNKIKKIFIKTLIAVGFAHAPFLFNLLILDFKLIYLTFVIYIWYNATLVVGINQIYQFNNILKSTIIVIAPFLIFVIFILYLMSNNPNGTIS